MGSLFSDPDLLARLVSFDTVSHRDPTPVFDFLSEYLDRPGVTFVRDSWKDAAGVPKTNLLVRLGPPADPAKRAGLVLSGHLDVVPADEPQWESDPFTLTARGGRLYARGSSDMKGFVALAVNTAARLDPERLSAPLALVLTCDEEVGTLGARHLVSHWSQLEPRFGPLPTAAVIGEPTELRVVRMHKGHLKGRVVVSGKSAHSGYPHLGDNAIERAGRVIGVLSTLRAELEGERPPHGEHFPAVPWVALNLGRIAGGTAVNIVPDRCVLDLSTRILPEMEAEAVSERIATAIAALDDPQVVFEPGDESPPLWVADDAPVVRVLEEETASLTGRPDGCSVSYATDAGWLQRLGLDCTIWGPGTIEVAHRPNEYLPALELEAAAAPLERLAARFCLPDL